MDLFEKIGKKFGLIKEESKTEQIKKDRENIINAVKSIKGTILCDKVLSESAETDFGFGGGR